MIKQPLFGQDSSPHVTSMFISAIATLVCWIIFCILCVVIKFKPQVPEYKEIQIVLESTPIEEKSEAAAVAELVEAPALEESVAEVKAPDLPNPVENPVAEAKVEAKKENPAPAKTQTTTAKTQPQKTTTTTKTTDPSKKVDFDNMQYATDYSDFDFNNTASSNSQTKNFDWSQFDDSDTDDVPVSQKVDKVTTSSSTSGSAASTSTSSQSQKSLSSSSSSSQTSTPAASSSTSAAAKAIQSATGANPSSGSTAGTSDIQKFSSDLDIDWNGGTARKAKGALSITLTTGSNIKEKKTTVRIEFDVGEDGYVTPGSVKITPESLLPKVVRDEVIAQINLWRFNEGSNRSKATFNYTIEKQQ